MEIVKDQSGMENLWDIEEERQRRIREREEKNRKELEDFENKKQAVERARRLQESLEWQRKKDEDMIAFCERQK